MHARVLLAPLFCLLAPVAVIPVVIPDGKDYSRETGYWAGRCRRRAVAGIAGWSLWAANSPGMGDDATHVTYSGIVDERRFYAQATGHAHPLTAADYLDYPRMAAVLTALDNTPDGALLLPSGNYTQWDLVPMMQPPPGSGPSDKAPQKPQHAVFFTNLGMLGMNVGLDVRVIDQIGLANPIAQHTRALEARPDRARQEPLPGLGDRRRPVGEGVIRAFRATWTRIGSPRRWRPCNAPRPKRC